MFGVLHGLFVEPLMRIYELLLDVPSLYVGMGGRIVMFSILLNLLLAPIYYEMDKRTRLIRDLKERVNRDVDRMRRYYKGRERYFYIRAVYRQHGFHPLSQLAGSADLLVQVVVFFTVYQFLSAHPAMAGAVFGPLRDLSQPDGLLGGINFLPFLMTLINIAAVFAYGTDRARRWQSLALAALFLALLYNSPAGLLLYWTTNNLFSLARSSLQRRLAGSQPGIIRHQVAELRRQA